MTDKPGQSPVSALFRRRIVFELTAEQLPLLEAAERRHGSKRHALLAALEAEQRIEALDSKAQAAERELARRNEATTRDAARKQKAQANAEKDLKQARAALKRLEAQLAAAKTDAADASGAHAAERDELYEVIELRDEQIEDLAERAVDKLYCGRCKQWVGPDDWRWRQTKDGGEYAYHGACGDHRPGVLDAASWLAYREP